LKTNSRFHENPERGEGGEQEGTRKKEPGKRGHRQAARGKRGGSSATGGKTKSLSVPGSFLQYQGGADNEKKNSNKKKKHRKEQQAKWWGEKAVHKQGGPPIYGRANLNSGDRNQMPALGKKEQGGGRRFFPAKRLCSSPKAARLSHEVGFFRGEKKNPGSKKRGCALWKK